jgi:hypothetical protein
MPLLPSRRPAAHAPSPPSTCRARRTPLLCRWHTAPAALLSSVAGPLRHPPPSAARCAPLRRHAGEALEDGGELGIDGGVEWAASEAEGRLVVVERGVRFLGRRISAAPTCFLGCIRGPRSRRCAGEDGRREERRSVLGRIGAGRRGRMRATPRRALLRPLDLHRRRPRRPLLAVDLPWREGADAGRALPCPCSARSV